MTSTAELIARSQSADGAVRECAFAELVRRYERTVIVTIWAIVRDFHTAQDVGQETFLIAYRNLGSLRTPNAFSAWLQRIARREALRAARRGKTVTSVAETARLATPAESPAWAETYAGVVDKLGRLPEQERTLVVLRYLDGHSIAEVVEMTGRPVGTVTKQLSRAIGRLRKWFVEVPQ
jgi:RNA polymerase sigma-70 factor (ECF subfamily)